MVSYIHTPDEMALGIVMARDGNIGMGTDKKPDIYQRLAAINLAQEIQTMHSHEFGPDTNHICIHKNSQKTVIM